MIEEEIKKYRQALGKTLRIIRVVKGMSLVETATKIGISPSHLSDIERGRKNTTFEVLLGYSKISNIGIDYIYKFAKQLDRAPKKTMNEWQKRAMLVIADIGESYSKVITNNTGKRKAR